MNLPRRNQPLFGDEKTEAQRCRDMRPDIWLAHDRTYPAGFSSLPVSSLLVGVTVLQAAPASHTPYSSEAAPPGSEAALEVADEYMVSEGWKRKSPVNPST